MLSIASLEQRRDTPFRSDAISSPKSSTSNADVSEELSNSPTSSFVFFYPTSDFHVCQATRPHNDTGIDDRNRKSNASHAFACTNLTSFPRASNHDRVSPGQHTSKMRDRQQSSNLSTTATSFSRQVSIALSHPWTTTVVHSQILLLFTGWKLGLASLESLSAW